MSEGARDRRSRLIGVIEAVGGPDRVEGLTRACAEVLVVSGASLMVMNAGVPSLLAATDRVSTSLEDLQHTLGEGPCVDAHDGGRAVFELDLAAPRRARWGAFGPAALAAGAAALFSFPLRVGGVRLGALTLYQARAGRLSGDQVADARVLAELVTATILAMQSMARPGSLGPELEGLMGYGAELHQAAGMTSVQLGIGVGEALARIRAHAYATERPLVDVAADIVARRLSLDA